MIFRSSAVHPYFPRGPRCPGWGVVIRWGETLVCSKHARSLSIKRSATRKHGGWEEKNLKIAKVARQGTLVVLNLFLAAEDQHTEVSDILGRQLRQRHGRHLTVLFWHKRLAIIRHEPLQVAALCPLEEMHEQRGLISRWRARRGPSWRLHFRRPNGRGLQGNGEARGKNGELLGED